MQNPDRIDFIAQILKRTKPLTDFLSRIKITGMNRVHQLHGSLGCNADAAAGKATNSEIPEVNNGRLLTNSTDNPFCRKNIQHFSEIVISGGIIANNRVLEP